MMRIPLPTEAVRIIDTLKAHGYKAYAVGGCVRDFVMGHTPDDYDITTDALPEQTAEVFTDAKVIKTGIKHGTVTVILNSFKAEITTFRIDGTYTDSRHPDEVVFCPELKEDLKRRDFTMNALAYNHDEGFMDFFGGIDDINSGTIRCVGEAEIRFSEDALRILRALRFASVLGFDIADSTANAIYTGYPLLANISAERIFTELKKLLCGKEAYTVLTKFKDVFCFLIPELGRLSDEDYRHTAFMVSKVPAVLKLSGLFYHCGAQGAHSALKRLKSDNKTTHEVCTIIQACSEKLSDCRIDSLKLLNKYDSAPMLYAIDLMLCDTNQPDCRMLTNLRQVITDIVSHNECYKISQLAVNGSDLINAGITDGKLIGKILNFILNEIIENRASNNREHLLKLIQNSDIKR